VTLVIPGRNAARTLAGAIDSARALPAGSLRQILFVDDGSSDGSAELARRHGAVVMPAEGRGPGAARNVGWRRAETEWVWFIDADCSVEAETLARLRATAGNGARPVSGVGGSYSNAVPGSLLARLIHAEIRERHLGMVGETDYLGSFNVLYRRAALVEAGGFDEGWVNGPGAPGAEDADLSYRLAAAGHRLLFCPAAVVAHHHPDSLWRYLRAQRLHGFWGVRLYRRHPGRGRANAYSGPLDHLQPVLALLWVGAVPVALWARAWWLPLLLLALLLLTTLPMTFRLAGRRGPEMLAFAPLAAVRALARGLGMLWGVLDLLTPGDWTPRR
jgi:glycosyltransferase involved in cell wall biosynthesis